LESRPQLVELRFVPAASADARRLFPTLDHARTLVDVTVISDDGAVFTGPNAWTMCLWALRDYRRLARAMSSPSLAPLARRVITMASARVAARKAVGQGAHRATGRPLTEGGLPRCDC
jgi:hypothetical protein